MKVEMTQAELSLTIECLRYIMDCGEYSNDFGNKVYKVYKTLRQQKEKANGLQDE